MDRQTPQIRIRVDFKLVSQETDGPVEAGSSIEVEISAPVTDASGLARLAQALAEAISIRRTEIVGQNAGGAEGRS